MVFHRLKPLCGFDHFMCVRFAVIILIGKDDSTLVEKVFLSITQVKAPVEKYMYSKRSLGQKCVNYIKSKCTQYAKCPNFKKKFLYY